MIDPFAHAMTWPALGGRRTLVVGLGGGSDAITACALAGFLDPSGAIAYANTKHELEPDMVPVSPRIGQLPANPALRGKTKIERRLPRGALGSPLVLALAPRDDPADLARDVARLGLDQIIGVDTGGDVLDTGPRAARGRDRRMLDVLRRARVPTLVAVCAPGADGQLSQPALATALSGGGLGSCLGAFSLEPLLPILRAHGRELGDERTPNIICRAFDQPTDPVEVPRGCRPKIPRRWLTSGLVFAPRSASR